MADIDREYLVHLCAMTELVRAHLNGADMEMPMRVRLGIIDRLRRDIKKQEIEREIRGK